MELTLLHHLSTLLVAFEVVPQIALRFRENATNKS
jgi:hypothetical protein